MSSFIVDAKPDVKLVTKYIFEYIDNEDDFKYVQSGRIDQGEPWERYKKVEFDNIGDALDRYMIALVSFQYYDFSLYEETTIDGEFVRDIHIEPSNTIGYSMRTWVDKNLTADHYDLKREHEQLVDDAQAMQEFIKRMRLEDQFKLFRQKVYKQG